MNSFGKRKSNGKNIQKINNNQGKAKQGNNWGQNNKTTQKNNINHNKNIKQGGNTNQNNNQKQNANENNNNNINKNNNYKQGQNNGSQKTTSYIATRRKKKPSNTVKKIDINKIYVDLKRALEKRAGYQENYENEWTHVKKTCNDRTSQIVLASDSIGKMTNEINVLIGELCKHKQRHAAMKLAFDFLQTEIIRTQRIVASWTIKVDKANRGEITLIDTRGQNVYSTASSEQYIIKKKNQLARLQKWQNHISQYV